MISLNWLICQCPHPVIIVAEDGYKVKEVKVDGASVGVPTSYSFTNVNAIHRISVVFEAVSLDQ